MSWIFGDTFDHYTTNADLLSKWTGHASGTGVSSTAIGAGSGRRGTNALTCSGSFGVTHGMYKSKAVGDNMAIVGVGFYPSTIGWGAPIITVQIGNSSTGHVSICYNTDGSIRALRGTDDGYSGTLLGTSDPGVLPAAAYTHIQAKIVIHDTTGYIEVRLNGSVLPLLLNGLPALTGIDTNNGGANVYNTIRLGGRQSGGSGFFAYDDFYWCDGVAGPVGAECNDFLGDIRGTAKVGTANGAMVGWTPNTGTNYAAVDDAAPNGDTDYNAITTAPATDTFIMPDADLVSDIICYQTCLYAKKADSGTAMIADVVRHAGVDYPNATPQAPGTGYGFLIYPHMVNPATGLRMTAAEWNAIEMGYKKTA